MAGGEELFEDIETKKEEKKKMGKDAIEIKIRFNKFWLERAIWIVIILVLLVLLFYNPFGKYRCEKGLGEITSAPIVTEQEEEETTEPEVEEEPEPGSETQLSGEAGLTIGDIGLNNDSKRIEYIWVYINNDKGLFTPLLRIYWYGPNTPDIVKDKVKYEHQFLSLISTGKTNKKLDNEIDRKGGRKLTGRYLNLDPDDKKATIKIELYDTNDNTTVLDKKLKTISVS